MRAERQPEAARARGSAQGYADRPVVKEPVWTWEIPVYFFIGGISGMAMLLAAVSQWSRGGSAGPEAYSALRDTCVLVALFGVVVSPALLISDLGRPRRFLNMLRRFNPLSPMSMGVWILVAFSVVVTLLAGGLAHSRLEPVWFGAIAQLIERAEHGLFAAGALLGGLLATYTGVLLGATAIPVWHRNRLLLPAHFGVAGLGGAVSVALLSGHTLDALMALLWVVLALETLLTLLSHWHSRSATQHAQRAWWLEAWPWLMLVLPAVALLVDLERLAALSFLVGSLRNRFAWLAAGRSSARNSAAMHTR